MTQNVPPYRRWEPKDEGAFVIELDPASNPVRLIAFARWHQGVFIHHQAILDIEGLERMSTWHGQIYPDGGFSFFETAAGSPPADWSVVARWVSEQDPRLSPAKPTVPGLNPFALRSDSS